MTNLSVDEALKLGVEAHREGKLYEADKYYTAILRAKPNHADANHNMGILALGVGKVERSLSFFKTAVETNPNVSQFWISYFEALLKLDRRDDALSLINQAKNSGLDLQICKKLENRILELEKIVEKDPSKKQVDVIIKLINQKKTVAAVESVKRLLKNFPNSALLHNLDGSLKISSREFSDAYASLQRAISFKPDFAEPYYNIGLLFTQQKKFEEAITNYKKAIELDKNYCEAHYNIGVICHQKGDIISALTSYESALKINPRHVQALNNLAVIHEKRGNRSSSINLNQQVLKIAPTHLSAYLNLCETYEKTNRLTELSDLIQKANSNIKPLESNLIYYDALINFRQKEYSKCSTLLRQIKFEHLAESRRGNFLQLKGKCLQELGDFGTAFRTFEKMNAHSIASPAYNKKEAEEYLRGLGHQLTNLDKSKKVKKKSLLEDTDNKIQFIIGFPRSGTTLLDTILRGHSQIEVIEEKPMVRIAKSHLLTNIEPLEIEKLNEEIIKNCRKAYVEELNKHVSEISKTMVIDKLPLNMLQIPIINRLFPNAKYIFAVRHPLDVLLSCFIQNFELNPAMAQLLNLKTAVQFYTLAMSFFEACRSRYLIDVHFIKYENVVSNFDAAIKEVIEFLGLEWEESLREYQNTGMKRAHIATPSYSSVVEPLYESAVYRWESYEEELSRYIKHIRPWINYFGY